MPAPPVALVGATASGKSTLAMALARQRGDVEIVSVDSMQVYRGMDLGTAKPTLVERAEVRHHLIDVLHPWQDFDVARFQADVRMVVRDISDRGRHALLVGGTGLYHRAVIDDLDIPGRYSQVRSELEADPDTESMHRRLTDLDPLAASRMEPNNRRRVLRALEVTVGSGRPFSASGPGLENYPATGILQVGVWVSAGVLAERIEARFAAQLEGGLLDEVRRLADLEDHGRPLSRTAAQALGYRELLAHLRGQVGIEEAARAAVVRTRRFARRQRSWFRRDPRIIWFGSRNDPLVGLAALRAEVDKSWGPVGG